MDIDEIDSEKSELEKIEKEIRILEDMIEEYTSTYLVSYPNDVKKEPLVMPSSLQQFQGMNGINNSYSIASLIESLVIKPIKAILELYSYELYMSSERKKSIMDENLAYLKLRLRHEKEILEELKIKNNIGCNTFSDMDEKPKKPLKKQVNVKR